MKYLGFIDSINMIDVDVVIVFCSYQVKTAEFI